VIPLASSSLENPDRIWNMVLRKALDLPGARVDRTAFLRKELQPRFPDDVVAKAIATRPSEAGIPDWMVRPIANGVIRRHRTAVSALSALLGLPGGWWLTTTVPADLAQFFSHTLQVAQKLAYLYGWPELSGDDGELDDETMHLLTIFVGVMFGVSESNKAVSEVSKRLAEEMARRLPKQPLTKSGVYTLAKQVAKWLGVKLTKDTFAKTLAKVVPILGGLISGTVTWMAFSGMSTRLREHLERLPLSGER